MFAEEWPLMMFTLFCQLAVGTFTLLTLAQTLLSAKDSELAVKLTRPGFIAVGPIMALALVLSLFHLGKPLGAYLSISNLGTSWLSREIFTAGAFIILWLVGFIFGRQGKSSSVLNWLTVLLGLLAVLSMAGIYSSSIRPAWTDANTFIAFYGTTLLLGVLGASVFILYGTRNNNLTPEIVAVLKKLGIIAAVALLFPLLYLPVFISHLSGAGAAGLMSAQMIDGYAFQIILRWVLSLSGLALFAHVLYRQAKAAQPVPMSMVYTALALVLVGEFLGRYLFYAAAVSIAIG